MLGKEGYSRQRCTAAAQLEARVRRALLAGCTTALGEVLPESAHELAATSRDASAALVFLRSRCGVTFSPKRLAESLEAAVGAGNAEAMGLLLQWGADPTAPALLHTAVAAGMNPARCVRSNRCLRLLLRQPGVDPNTRRSGGAGPTVLEAAVDGANEEAAHILLEAGATPTPPVFRRAIWRQMQACLEACLTTERGAAAFGSIAPVLLRELIDEGESRTAAFLLRHCPASALPYEVWTRILTGDLRLSFNLLHAILLFHHRAFPDTPPVPAAICNYAEALRWGYSVKEYTPWWTGRDKFLDWHRRCPHGLDAAARRMLTAVGAPVARMEAWLARFRGSLAAGLGDILPPPLRLLVSLY